MSVINNALQSAVATANAIPTAENVALKGLQYGAKGITNTVLSTAALVNLVAQAVITAVLYPLTALFAPNFAKGLTENTADAARVLAKATKSIVITPKKKAAEAPSSQPKAAQPTLAARIYNAVTSKYAKAAALAVITGGAAYAAHRHFNAQTQGSLSSYSFLSTLVKDWEGMCPGPVRAPAAMPDLLNAATNNATLV